MTVSVEGSAIVYDITVSTTTLAYGKPLFDDADLEVLRQDASGVESTLVRGVDWTWSPTTTNNNDPMVYPDGGTVTLTVPYTDGSFTVRRAVTDTQPTQYPAGGALPGPSLEASLDRITFQVQELQEQIGRAIQFPETEGDVVSLLPTAPNRLTQFIGFDASGDLTVAASASVGEITVSAFAVTLLDDTNAATARTTLGLAALATLATVSATEIDALAVTEAKLAADAVALSKIKAGTGLSSIRFNAAGDPAEVIPEVQVVASGVTLPYTGTLAIIKTFEDGYDYDIWIEDIEPSADNKNIEILVYTDGGTTPLTGVIDFSVGTIAGVNTTASAQDFADTIATDVLDTSAGTAYPAALHIHLRNPTSVDETYATTHLIAGGSSPLNHYGGFHVDANAINAIGIRDSAAGSITIDRIIVRKLRRAQPA